MRIFAYEKCRESSTYNLTIFFLILQGIVILLLPYEHLVQLYMHLIAASLLILEDIMSRVYVEEEVAISDSASKSKLLGSNSYKQRQFCQIGNVQL